MKRLIKLCLITFILTFLLNVETYSAAPSISAQGAAVIDVTSGRILYEKNANQKLPIASLTKIMTAIVAIEEGNLTDKVKTGKNAVGAEGSSIYLRLGEELSLEDMLYGLMLRSGNDAAIAIAEHVGGSVNGFSYMMNEKARYIGLSSSNFVNPHGLDHPEHYSTARDLALLTAYALKNPIFQKIVSTQMKTAPLEGFDWDRKWFNKNKMLRTYPGANGVKTGFTRIAKRCLVSSATRGERQIAVVVLNDGNDWRDSANLLDYGFNEYQNIELMKKNQLVDNTNFLTIRDSIYPLKAGEEALITSKVVLNRGKKDGVTPVAYLEIYLSNKIIDRVPLKLKMDQQAIQTAYIEKSTKVNSFWNFFYLFWRQMM